MDVYVEGNGVEREQRREEGSVGVILIGRLGQVGCLDQRVHRGQLNLFSLGKKGGRRGEVGSTNKTQTIQTTR